MKLTKEKLDHSIKICKQCILSKMQRIPIDKKEFLVWPLFFLESEQPREDGVDVCATALGVISSSNFIGNDKQSDIYNAVKGGIDTLLYVRNPDGSWPSKISLVAKDTVSMEGVISDTYFALSALMKIDFIKQTSIISDIRDPITNKELTKLEERQEIINKGVIWLLENRVGQGWGYTGTKYIENKSNLSEYVVPSMNAITILSQVQNAVKEINPQDVLIKKIDTAINDTVNWICEIQNQDGGFGIKRGEASRVVNTAKVVVALYSVTNSNDAEEKVSEVINKAIKYIIKNYKSKKITFESVNENFLQLVVENNDNKSNPYNRPIIHESYLEPLIIESLGRYFERNMSVKVEKTPNKNIFLKNKIYSKIKNACEEMLSHQIGTGALQGAVKSRRSGQGESYPIYACNDMIHALIRLNDNNELLNHIKAVPIKMVLRVVLYIAAIVFLFFSYTLTEAPLWMNFVSTILCTIIINIISNLLLDKWIIKIL